MASENTVLVTGGGGFIGSHLIERLLADGARVRVLDNFATGSRENLEAVGGDVELIEGDIQSYERVHNAVNGCELVFHVAALPSVPRSIQDPLTSTNVNVIGTLNVLLAARDAGVRRVVYASSSSVYGPNAELPQVETATPSPIAPYAVSKLAGEGYARSFADVYGLETVALRYFNVFGPRQDPRSQYAAVIPLFVTAALEGEGPTIFGDGEQSRDFTYVDNVVDGTIRAGSAPGVSGRAFNIACGRRITLNEVWDEVRGLAGIDADAEHVEPRAGDIRHSQADVSSARDLLGYEPSVDTREGIRRVFGWHRERARPARTG